MSLPIPFRNEIKNEIKNEVDKLINQRRTPGKQAKNRWNFKNSSDWHHGHFVGMMMGLANSQYASKYGKSMTPEQMKGIEELLEEYTKELREYFQSFDKE